MWKYEDAGVRNTAADSFDVDEGLHIAGLDGHVSDFCLTRLRV